MSAFDIIASVSIRLSGEKLDRKTTRLVLASVAGVEVKEQADLYDGISIEYGPTSDWRSVTRVLLEVLRSLVRDREKIGFSDSEASIFIASSEETTWSFSADEIALLSAIRATVFVRVLDTSKSNQ